MKVYGITNCNTVKKAIEWLRNNEGDFEFHDYKKKGISKEKLEEWSAELGWKNLLNKKGTTWRALDERTQNAITTQATAIGLMMEYTSIIKRPLIEKGDKVIAIRFDEAVYEKAFL